MVPTGQSGSRLTWVTLMTRSRTSFQRGGPRLERAHPLRDAELAAGEPLGAEMLVGDGDVVPHAEHPVHTR